MCLLFALALPPAVSFFAIEWSDEGVERFPGGVVLRDSAGQIVRVGLGPGDVDCRPWYRVDRDDWIVKAIVAAEDGEFWRHWGVRPASVVRAFWQNAVCRRRVSGASTLTMQTVRLIHPHRKNYIEKWIEAVKAVKLERRHDKDWILAQYLNRAPFGANFVGIEAAAQGYFGKPAKDLALDEAALLAGMVQAPSRFRPDRHCPRAVKRREYVLERMFKLGFINAEQRRLASAAVPKIARSPRPFAAPHYCDFFLQSFAESYGRPPRGDITMPLDPVRQAICERATAAAAVGGRQAAAVVCKTATGEVVALSVGGDYFGDRAGQFNAALAPRPAGSTLKPLLASIALRRRMVTLDTMLEDLPMAKAGYSPANFDGDYRHQVSLADALVMSLNLPFVRLLDRIGVDEFAAQLRALGFAHLGDVGQLGLGLAIGNAEITLVELARAYAAFAAGGTPEAYAVWSALSGPERSRAAVGHDADVKLPVYAWKTGTSAGYRDAWTVAWNPEYVVAVWCGYLGGNFGDSELTGARAAAPVVWRIIREMSPPGEGPAFAPPPGAAAMMRGNSAAKMFETADETEVLTIRRPAAGAVYVANSDTGCELVAELADANGVGEVWWFLDGQLLGRAAADSPISFAASPGEHRIAVAAAGGRSGTIAFSVSD